MKTTRTFDFPVRWAAPGLVTGLLLLSGVAAAAGQKFPATGQTTCWDSGGAVIACTGTGQDGDIQAGATLRYRDNRNGTITDRNTRLVWEKKSDDGSIHDMDNAYTWDEAFAVHVATLNTICANDQNVTCSVNADCAGVGGKCGFAGKRDWRVPNIKELPSIVNYQNPSPSVSAAFNTNCPGATVLTGSCTAASVYWSSTSVAHDPSSAWFVFFNGSVFSVDKTFVLFPIHVRAVRGGLYQNHNQKRNQKFPATGQTTCYDSGGAVIACTGTGQDGDIQAGATLRYRDNGNGTITDKNTRLVWEKKSDDGSIHDMDNFYFWDEAFAVYVATLNTICANDQNVTCSVNADCAGVRGKCGFAGKRDWRVPNIKELPSIVNYQNPSPSVSAAFNTNCPGATVLTGSCTAESVYWSSTSFAIDPSFAWFVGFFDGRVLGVDRSEPFRVRAVRGGL